MGRQVFASENPRSHVAALRAIIHQGATAKEASELLGGQ